MTNADRSLEHKNIIYESFILAISVLAIINIFILLLTNDPNMDAVLVIVNLHSA